MAGEASTSKTFPPTTNLQKFEMISTVTLCCAANEHVKRIERRIRLIKERNRCYWVNLPYTKASKVMIDENLFDINEWLNAYSKNGILRK